MDQEGSKRGQHGSKLSPQWNKNLRNTVEKGVRLRFGCSGVPEAPPGTKVDPKGARKGPKWTQTGSKWIQVGPAWFQKGPDCVLVARAFRRRPWTCGRSSWDGSTKLCPTSAPAALAGAAAG